MDLKKENKQLKEYIIVLKNYCNVLKKKNQIQKDSMVRNQKLILKLQDEIKLLKKRSDKE